jgi:hypothetical protein
VAYILVRQDLQSVVIHKPQIGTSGSKGLKDVAREPREQPECGISGTFQLSIHELWQLL